MTDLNEWKEQAHAWLESMVETFGIKARRGLSQQEELAVGRAYQRAKYEAGYAGITLPIELGGQGLGPLHKMAFERAEHALGMPVGFFRVSLGMPIPITARYASDRDWVKKRITAALKGDEIWCQLFSEPGAGSDLAGLRTSATRDGDGWRINGQKLWTTWAQYADYGVIVVRTDPSVPKHKGLTYFWLDMHAPGVTVRPIRLADGGDHVNEVWFDDVFVHDHQRLSDVGKGFAVAIETLMIERYAASDSNGFGPDLAAFVSLAENSVLGGQPAIEDGRIRSAIARSHAMRSGLENITHQAMMMLEQGLEPGPEGSIAKLVSVRSRQKLSELALDMMGNTGFAWDSDATPGENWAASWLNAPTGRIAGGADEMLLNTIAEKILGLPQDHRPDKGVPFNQVPT